MKVDTAALAAAAADRAARATAASAAATYGIARATAPMKIDGEDADWAGVATMEIARDGSPLADFIGNGSADLSANPSLR